MQKIADLREKAILDEKAIYARGIEVGEKKGREEGIKEGREEGIAEGIKQIAKNMLEEGVDIKTIVKLTGLTETEILGK